MAIARSSSSKKSTKKPAGKRTVGKTAGKSFSKTSAKKSSPSHKARSAARKKKVAQPKTGTHLSGSSANRPQNDETRTLVLKCAKAIIDKKAESTMIMSVGELGSFTDYFLVASGSNEKQVQAMADAATQALKATGLTPAVEGYNQGRWILVDAGAIVLHLFHDDIRGFYNLEQLWTGAPRVQIPAEYYVE